MSAQTTETDNPGPLAEEKVAGVEAGPPSIELLDTLYANMLEQEDRPPDDADRITFGHFKSKLTPTEREQLVAAGVTEEQLAQGTLTRGELLRAGFVFLNRLGDGEQAILSGTVPFGDGAIDLSDRVFLTREELDAVYNYQQSHAEEFGAHGRDIDDLRRDMLSFVLAADKLPPFDSVTQLVLEMTIQADRGGLGKQLNALVASGLRKYVSEHPGVDKQKATTQVMIALLREHAPDIVRKYTTGNDRAGVGAKQERRGTTVTVVGGRRGHQTEPIISPFLDRGAILTVSRNPDVAVQTSHGQYRMNLLTIHLAGGHPNYPGLSEMGGTQHDLAAWNQAYMPTGVFAAELYAADPLERHAVESEEADILQATMQDYGAIAGEALERLVEATGTKKRRNLLGKVASRVTGLRRKQQ